MTHPSSKQVARALLGTFSQDEVPSDSKERAFAAFGVAAAVTGISTIATGGASGAAVTASGPAVAMVAKSAATAGAFSVLKAGIAGAVMGVLAVQAADRVTAYSHDAASASHRAATHHPDEPTAPTQRPRGHGLETANPAVPVAPPLMPAPDLREPAGTDPSPAALGPAIPTLSAPVPSSRARSATGAHVGTTASIGNSAFPSLAADEKPAADSNAAPAVSAVRAASATLTGEITRLDRSRAALREGAPARAIRELDGYDAEFANGSLRQEADVLRIEVLVEMGENVRAHTLANAFAHAHPTSGYLAKIRELLARGPKRTAP